MTAKKDRFAYIFFFHFLAPKTFHIQYRFAVIAESEEIKLIFFVEARKLFRPMIEEQAGRVSEKKISKRQH
jgi:hypothetical protein